MTALKRVIKIESAEYIDGYRLKLFFSDDAIRTVDFGNFLEKSNHPEVRRFLVPKHFKSFKVKDGELMWGDFDLVFPIMALYQNRL